MTHVNDTTQQRNPPHSRPYAQHLLEHVGIKLPAYHAGRYKTTCPVCSEHRRKQRLKCLFVIIKSETDCGWKCNHCLWTGPHADDVRGFNSGRDHVRPAYQAPPEAPWNPIMPVPAGARQPGRFKLRCDHLAVYRDVSSNLLFYVRRYDKPDGKLVLPLTYGYLGRRLDWHERRVAPPIPLYGLPLLRRQPHATVVLVEGEKKADHFNDLATQEKLPCIALSWCGGWRCAEHASLRPLRNRDVVIWPDADEEGRAAGEVLYDRLEDIASSTGVVRTTYFPEHFDCGDVQEGLSTFLLGV